MSSISKIRAHRALSRHAEDDAEHKDTRAGVPVPCWMGGSGSLLGRWDDDAVLEIYILLPFPGQLVALALVQSSVLSGLKDYSRLHIHFL